jgi:hypothetical protein
VKTAVLLGVAIVLVATLGVFSLLRERGAKLAHLSAASPRLALGAGGLEALAAFERGAAPDIYYHVVLQEVPLGRRLDLSCEWVDPAGQVARRNRYRTRFVYKATWPTHCHQQFTGASASGPWHVRLTMNDRVLSDSVFTLR